MENQKPVFGLDMAKGLEKHNGNKENYFTVLRSYLAGSKSKLGFIEDTKNLKQYEITVHGIKGASRGIGAEDIGNMASELENAAVTGNIDFISKNNASFLEDLKKLLYGIEEMFMGMDCAITKKKKDKPDKEILLKLLEACEIYDMTEAEAAITEISGYQYECDDGLAEWLQCRAEEMQYDQIAEKLNSLINPPDNAS